MSDDGFVKAETYPHLCAYIVKCNLLKGLSCVSHSECRTKSSFTHNMDSFTMGHVNSPSSPQIPPLPQNSLFRDELLFGPAVLA